MPQSKRLSTLVKEKLGNKASETMGEVALLLAYHAERLEDRIAELERLKKPLDAVARSH